MYKYLSKKEQIELSEVLSRVAVYSKPEDSISSATLDAPILHGKGRMLGIPVLRKLHIVE